MKSIALICLILFGSVAIVSCKKSSNKWLTGEFQIIDAVTKEPVKAKLQLDYYAGYAFGSEKTTEEIGVTDENGFFELEKKINRKDSQFILNIDAFGYYGFYQSNLPDASREISKSNHNVITIEVPPLYVMSLSLNNISCHDATDTVWINQTSYPQSSRIFTGCLNAYKPNEVYYWGNAETVSFRSISKKNGLYDTLVHSYTMGQGNGNNFDLNY